jgi:hypothetical protein
MQAEFVEEAQRLICEAIAQLAAEPNPDHRQQISAKLQPAVKSLCGNLLDENSDLQARNNDLQANKQEFKRSVGRHHAAIVTAQRVSDIYNKPFLLEVNRCRSIFTLSTNYGFKLSRSSAQRQTQTLALIAKSYVDLLKQSRQAIDALLLARQEVLGRVHAWERAGVAAAVSPPESSGVQQ